MASLNQFGPGGGARPNSQSGGGVRPASGMRSSYGAPVAGGGQSLNKNVEVQARPAVMREGMKGVGAVSRAGVPGTSAGFGPGRTSKDRSYWIGLLRPKVTDLTAEMERLKVQEEQIQKNSGQLTQLQSRQKDLQAEIAKMKSDLDALNQGIERINDDPDHINAQAQQLRQANIEQRKLVDQLFLSAKEAASQCQKQEQLLVEENQRAEQAFAAGPEGRRLSDYVSARDQCYRVADAAMQMQQEIRALIAKQDLMMQQFGADADRKKTAMLVLERLTKRQTQERMAKECSVSVDQEREMLIQSAKTAKHDIDVLERQILEAKDALQESRNRLQQVTLDLQEYSGDNTQKFLELQQKDKELQGYVESLPEREKEEINKIKEVEANIVAVLEHLSRKIQVKETMPAENAPQLLANMAAELEDKQRHLEAAQVTHQRLVKELEERKEELAKVEFLDEKISTELETTDRRMKEQQQDIKRYEDLDALRQSIEARKKALIARKAQLLKSRDTTKQHVHLLNGDFETKKRSLNDNEVHASLVALEHTLRNKWQTAFALEEFVRLKEKETQYTHIKADVLRIADEINGIVRDPKRFDATTGSGNGTVTMIL